MATVIDTLVIELGLDPTKLTKGQQQALAGFKKTQEEALKSGKAIEGAAERVTQFLGKMRNTAVGFAAAAFGANGIREFVQQVTTSNAALDRSAKLLGTTTNTLSAWRGAAELAGGTAAGLQQSVAGLINGFRAFAITGQLPESAQYLRALKVEIADATGKMYPFEKVMLDISKAMHELPVGEAVTIGHGLGFDEGTINFILKGPDAMRALLNEMKNLNTVNAEAAAISSELGQSWTRLASAAQGAGNRIVTEFSPVITWLFNGLASGISSWNSIFDKNKKADLQGQGTPRPPGAEALRVKPGSGTASLGVSALASSLQSSIPGLKEFTSFNDSFHAGKNSKHNQGLALDFTVSDPSKYAETASAVRRRLAELGIEGTVLDEHNHPSAGSSGSHIHVQFANAAAANKFSAAGGAGAAAIANAGNTRGEGSKVETNIGTLNVIVPGGTSEEISRNLPAWIERRGIGLQAQTGPW